MALTVPDVPDQSPDRSAIVVAYGPTALSDFLMTVPALRALRAKFTTHRILLYGTPSSLRPLVAATGAVDEHIGGPPESNLAPDVAVHLRTNLRSLDLEGLQQLRSLRPRRLIALGPHGSGLQPWRGDLHQMELWRSMLWHDGILVSRDSFRLDPNKFGVRQREITRTVIHPGASSVSRMWPVERWAQVAQAELDAQRSVVLTGNAGEADLVNEIVHGLSAPPQDPQVSIRAFVGEPIGELAALIGSSGRFLSGDTGPGHLACALDTPSVMLFGPTSPDLWGPPPGTWLQHPEIPTSRRDHMRGPSDLRRHIVLWAGHSGDPFGSEADPGLALIDAGDVVHASEALDYVIETMLMPHPESERQRGRFNGGGTAPPSMATSLL